MNKFLLTFCLTLALCACSTRDREVKIYSIAKTEAAPKARSATPPQESGALKWKSPPGWKELPGDSIRLAGFEIRSEGGKTADASIVMLGGDAGGVTANVNRWRAQAGLEPVSAAEITKEASKGMAGIGEFQQFQIHGAEGKPSILAAIIPHSGQTLFVKLTGSQEILNLQRQNFTALCRSLRASSEN